MYNCFNYRFVTTLTLLVSLEAIKSQEFRPVVLKHKNLGERDFTEQDSLDGLT